ncbi:MAG: hypothetical protein KAQ62_21675 [Cyclobacteriaceae bacterium]|nr:hypothetical protein [Cyclobacteriaceae bacterium]
MHRKRIAQLVILFFNVHLALAQNIEPVGSFIQKKIKIGEEIYYTLSVKYDKKLNVLFPDSSYRYGTFEYNSRTWFKTKSDSTLSYDSVIYNLSTFEIDSIQYLQLPVFVLNNEDSLAIFSKIDSINLIQVVAEIPEKPEFLANTDLFNINRQFNYPYFLIGIGGFVFLSFIVLLFFGKQIAKAWKVYRIKRIRKKFIVRFFNLMRDVSGNNPGTTTEHVLAVWKNYMERLEKKPISKLTTKEILVLHNNGQLKENLKLIDRCIYGGEKGNDLFASFDYLMKYSIEICDLKITEIKNG